MDIWTICAMVKSRYIGPRSCVESESRDALPPRQQRRANLTTYCHCQLGTKIWNTNPFGKATSENPDSGYLRLRAT